MTVARRALKTRRLILRPIRPSDLAAYYDYARRPEVWVTAGFPKPESVSDTRAFVRRAVSRWGKPPAHRTDFAILRRKDRRWVGGIDLRWPHGGVGELGYGLHPDFRGKGYAAEAARAIVDWAFERGAHRVQATCWVENAPSVRLLRRLGMRREGILRGFLRRGSEIRDEFQYGMTRKDWEGARG